MDNTKKIITKSFSETQKVGQNFAYEILASGVKKTAVVLALSGDLGAGKTTFLQGFAKGLGIKEKILSPTFILMKKFKISMSLVAENTRSRTFCYEWFYHIDCYRLNNPEPASAKGSDEAREILDLGFKEIISNPKNIVAIEWPERVKKILSKNIILINFKHLEPASAKGSDEARENKRELTINK